MRIVLATYGLRGIGGSETYLLTVAEQLRRLGHDITIRAVETGAMSDIVRGRGLDVADTPADLPEGCDVVLTQDVIVAHELADLWPRTPQAFVAHSDLFDLQLPPVLPAVTGAVVALSDRVAARVAAMDADHEIVRLRQPVDTERLAPRGAPRDRPRRALLLGNWLSGQRRRLLQETWGEHGVDCVVIGDRHDPVHEPAAAVAAADIVVGKGRVAVEAMAWGRPTYVYDAFGGDGWVTPASYAAMEADAFAGQSSPGPVDAAALRRDLERYDPALGVVGRELAVTHHGARRHAHELVALFRRLAPDARPSATPAGEIARLSRLRWHAEREAYGLRQALDELAEQARAATDDAGAARAAERAARTAAKAEAEARAEAEAQRAAATDRAQAAETTLAHARGILAQRRVRVGIAGGRVADRLRGAVRR